MQHCDAEPLALLALGDAVATDQDTRHLRQCAACRAELDQLTAIVSAGRRIEPDDAVAQAPPQVWQDVRSALDLPADLVPFVPSPPAAAEAEASPGSSGVVDLSAARAARRGSPWYLAAAAVLGVAVGSLATATMSGSGEQAEQVVVASSSLSAVQTAAGDPIDGEATVVERNGQEYLQVQIDGLTGSSAFFEVWLLKPDLSGMVSMGALAGGSAGQFVIPSGISIEEYSVVDISREPLDGDPAHSKDSLARGTLGA